MPQETKLRGNWKSVGPFVYAWTNLTVKGKEGSGYWESSYLSSEYFGGWGLGDIGGYDTTVEINPTYAQKMQTNSLKDILNSAIKIRSHAGGWTLWGGASFIGTTDDGTIVYNIYSTASDVGFNIGYAPPATGDAPVWKQGGLKMSHQDSIKQAKSNKESVKGDTLQYSNFVKKHQ